MVDQDSRESLVSSDEWYWYDKSKLAFWLRYDTWPAELGLCLICDIDPEKSEELDFDELVDMVDIKPEDKPPYALYKGVCLLSEDPVYILEPAKRPDRRQFTKAKQYLKDRTDWLNKQYFKEDRDDINPEYINPDYTDICDRIRLRGAVRDKHGECWMLFGSNPKHSEQETFAPSYFVDWAASKNIEIPWLKWAEERDLLKAPETETPAVIDTPDRTTPSDKRRKEGLIAAISLLRQEHASGKLRAWQDFETCMRKAVVIDYIRKNPTAFPHCARTKPILDKNDGQSIKDREPTLTKSFPDFTKTTEIVDEYDRLTSIK